MTSGQRTILARQALAAALDIRRKTRRATLQALSVYDVCEEVGVDVWFQALPSLEGMYSSCPGPAIILGSERPATRRVYTCAHELGHHAFGHGTRIDELPNDASSGSTDPTPEEFIAQTFAGFLLMPKLAVLNAFAQRGWSASEPTAEQLYAVASYFGVGYQTLLAHLRFCLGLIGTAHGECLEKVKLKEIRGNMGAQDIRRPLIVTDQHWKGRAVDVEVGDIILAPADAITDGKVLRLLSQAPERTFWEPITPGLGRLVQHESHWAANVRVARTRFTGRARFRHLPEGDSDEK